MQPAVDRPTSKRGVLPNKKEFVRNLRVGLGLGILTATALSVWSVAVRVLVGTQPFEQSTFSVGTTVIHYYMGFSASGALVGLLMPLRRWALGSMFLGIVFVLPVYLLFATSYARSVSDVGSWQLPGIAIVSVVVGGALGLWSWFNDRRTR
jgi:hypothetical protein